MTVDFARTRYAHWSAVLWRGIAMHQRTWIFAPIWRCDGCAFVCRQVEAAAIRLEMATAAAHTKEARASSH